MVVLIVHFGGVAMKLKSNSGFTLYETLVAVGILAMLCLMVTAGISFAIRSYQNTIAVDESELLVDSLSNAISDKYRYAVVSDGVADVGEPSIDGGFALLGGRKLLSDGSYSVQGHHGDVLRRYLVEDFIVTQNVDESGYVSFDVTWRVGEKNGFGSPCEREFTVMCLTPNRVSVSEESEWDMSD